MTKETNNGLVQDGIDYIAYTENIKELAKRSQEDYECFLKIYASGRQPELGPYVVDMLIREHYFEDAFSKIMALHNEHNFELKEPRLWYTSYMKSEINLGKKINQVKSLKGLSGVK